MSPKRERAQQRIGDGVRKNIGVGVALQAKFGRNRDAAQNHRPAGCDAMNVPALADSKLAQRSDARAVISSARNNRARSMSDGLVIFILRSLPGTTLTST